MKILNIFNEKIPLIFQVLWTFSIYLESVAIMPQLFMLSKTGSAETITAHYLFALGLNIFFIFFIQNNFSGIYRGLYILNWVYRYYMGLEFFLILFLKFRRFFGYYCFGCWNCSNCFVCRFLLSLC